MRQDDRVIRWFCRFEKVLVRLVIAGAVMLVLAQAVVVTKPAARLLDLANLDEYEPAMVNVEDPRDSIVLTFELLDVSSLGQAKILVNGTPQANFGEKYTTIRVEPGDEVEIDGTFYERPFRVKLINVYPETAKPVKGVIHTVKRGLHPVGRVEPK